jgi:hypothetical protein
MQMPEYDLRRARRQRADGDRFRRQAEAPTRNPKVSCLTSAVATGQLSHGDRVDAVDSARPSCPSQRHGSGPGTASEAVRCRHQGYPPGRVEGGGEMRTRRGAPLEVSTSCLRRQETARRGFSGGSVRLPRLGPPGSHAALYALDAEPEHRGLLILPALQVAAVPVAAALRAEHRLPTAPVHVAPAPQASARAVVGHGRNIGSHAPL